MQEDIHETEMDIAGARVLGIDPSGEGSDETVWVLRDQFKAK